MVHYVSTGDRGGASGGASGNDGPPSGSDAGPPSGKIDMSGKQLLCYSVIW